MDDVIYLFPQTIENIENRLKSLRDKHRVRVEQSPTGSTTRLMDPKLTSLYEEICDLDEIFARARELKKPQDRRSVDIGHCVTVENKSGSVLRFHICSELDVKYQGDIDSADGRMLSRESELGKKMCGQSVGTKVSHGDAEFTIKDIEISGLLM